MRPKITFIVSAFDRPEHLKLCLQSLLLQTEREWEVIVTDNANTDARLVAHWKAVEGMDDLRFSHKYTGNLAPTCYHSSEIGARFANGEWLCFPSDDSYYTPMFAEKMLHAGETGEGCDIQNGDPTPAPLDLVCCDFVWGRETTWTYCDGGPQMCHIDKTTFIIRRETFIAGGGWPGKKDDGSPSASDGLLAESLVAKGARIGRVADVLVVHNP